MFDRGSCLRIAILLLAWGQAVAQPAAAVGDPAKRIFQPAPLQWDSAMLTNRPALQQTTTDLANLTGGILFGMSSNEVNARLPEPYPGLTWSGLPAANEYPGEVRYFWSRLDAAGALRVGDTACAGATSYVVFLFSSRGLFRLSYRLVPDKACPAPDAAAQAIFAYYVRMNPILAQTVRYRTGVAEVVDVTDPTAGYLNPIRWRKGMN